MQWYRRWCLAWAVKKASLGSELDIVWKEWSPSGIMAVSVQRTDRRHYKADHYCTCDRSSFYCCSLLCCKRTGPANSVSRGDVMNGISVGLPSPATSRLHRWNQRGGLEKLLSEPGLECKVNERCQDTSSYTKWACSCESCHLNSIIYESSWGLLKFSRAN